jgi:hypothetical protein
MSRVPSSRGEMGSLEVVPRVVGSEDTGMRGSEIFEGMM